MRIFLDLKKKIAPEVGRLEYSIAKLTKYLPERDTLLIERDGESYEISIPDSFKEDAATWEAGTKLVISGKSLLVGRLLSDPDVVYVEL